MRLLVLMALWLAAYFLAWTCAANAQVTITQTIRNTAVSEPIVTPITLTYLDTERGLMTATADPQVWIDRSVSFCFTYRVPENLDVQPGSLVLKGFVPSASGSIIGQDTVSFCSNLPAGSEGTIAFTVVPHRGAPRP